MKFCSPSTARPVPVGIVQGTDGTFYGTAGFSTAAASNGIVFKITPAGKFTILHNFAGYPNDGSQPYGQIIQAADGNFYGTTVRGVKNNLGHGLQNDAQRNVTIIHSFDGTAGQFPYAGPVQATDGKIMGRRTGRAASIQATIAGAYSSLAKLTGTTGANPGSRPQIPLFSTPTGPCTAPQFMAAPGQVILRHGRKLRRLLQREHGPSSVRCAHDDLWQSGKDDPNSWQWPDRHEQSNVWLRCGDLQSRFRHVHDGSRAGYRYERSGCRNHSIGTSCQQ